MHPLPLLLLMKIATASANYLEAESNYLKPKLERNNIVNKGVWVKNKLKDSLFEKTNVGDFIFRPISADVDNILQNNFDAFGENYLQDAPFLSSYVERSKRSADNIRKRHPRKSMKKCKNKKNCKYSKNNFKDDGGITESNFISDLKPASMINDYPYEVAILLNSNKINIEEDKSDTNKTIHNNTNVMKNITKSISIETEKAKLDLNETKYDITNLKRAAKSEYEQVDYKNFVLLDDNKTNNFENDKERSVFDKDDKIWHHNSPGVDMYKVIPKEQKIKPINERGLIKVISMLTKTFKKIMKQHEEIKIIHDQLKTINDDFLKNLVDVTSKFRDFDTKYNYLIKCNEDLKKIEQNLIEREEHFKHKQTEMTKNLIEFENQQKKFLIQQKQFYSIQKFMLDQNEKINTKQSLIAKTQSEISHRQNNFARILKKAKQVYIDNKNSGPSKPVLNNKKHNTTGFVSKDVTHTTTTVPEVTESVKINLFHIPTTNRIGNQDEMIIKEKDDQAIDDLVYKFYFNNTFIDNIMKNKVFNNYTPPESNENGINLKNKRNELTTLLLPVTKINITVPSVKRNKRWISRSLKRNLKRKSHLKSAVKDSKVGAVNNDVKTIDVKDKKDKPFLIMATNFCNQIGQNGNEQILGWCVEKALRRLQYMDTNMFKMPALLNKEKELTNRTHETEHASNITTATEITTADPTTLQVVVLNSQTTPVLAATEDLQSMTFFPDNDELESNLKQYDLQPDTEGNVYYDGSIHASDLVPEGPNTESISDLMPGLDSNSKVDVDPLAFDLQARRRAFVERLNANILKRIHIR